MDARRANYGIPPHILITDRAGYGAIRCATKQTLSSQRNKETIMVGKRELRQAAMAAARAKHGAPLATKASKESTPAPQPSSQSVAEDQRRDNLETARREQSSNGERTQPTGLSRTRALRKERPKPKPKDTSAADTTGIFGSNDKRQKKIVYHKFSEGALDALDIIVEDVPRPTNDRSVVVKITVRFVPIHASFSTSFETQSFSRKGIHRLP